MIKRICALLLVWACILTSAAGAAYTDQSQITATEAVSMLSSMGIITGNADGSYGPTTPVTRGQMAKMLYTLCLNSSDATAYKDVPTSFTDVSGTTYAGYIKYCEIAGLLAGYSGKFSPDTKITGIEAARMLLLVMGYTQAHTKLTGSVWQSSVLSVASDKGLMDDISYDMTAALTRQCAAQLIYNAINADYVQWSTNAGEYDTAVVSGVKQTVGTKYLKLGTSVGILVKVEGNSLKIAQSSIDEEDSTNTLTTFGKITQDYTGLLGHRVRILTRNSKVDQVLGVFETSGSTCTTVCRTDIVQSSSAFKVDSTRYTLDSDGVKIYVDGNYSETYTESSSFVSTQSPDLMILVDDDNDGELELALQQTYLVAPVTTVTKKAIKVDGTTYTMADNNIQSGLAVDDYVIITENGYTNQLDIVKATLSTGSVTGVDGDSDPYDKYQIDSTWYYRAADHYAMNSIKGGETVQYIQVNHVIFYAKATSDVTTTTFSNVALVLAVASTDMDGNQAKLLFMDGSTKIVTISDKSSVAYSAMVKGNFYEFSADTKGEYRFNQLTTSEDYYSNYTAVDNTLITGWSGATPSGGKAVSKTSYNGVTLASGAQVILYYAPKGSFQIVSANQFYTLCSATKSVINTSGGLGGFMIPAATKKDKNLAYLMAVAVKSMPDLEEDNYGYLVTDSVLTGKNTLSYTIWDGSSYHTVLEQIGGTTVTLKSRLRGMVVGYSDIDNDGTIVDPVSFASESDGIYIRPVKSVSGSTLTYSIQSKERTFTVSSSTKILYVNSTAGSADTIGQTSGTIRAASVTNNGYLLPNTMLIAEDTTGISLLVVDVQNKLDVPGMYQTVTTKKVTSGKTKAVISGATTAKIGDKLTLTLTDSAGATKTVTLKNAVFADTGSATRVVTLAAKQTATYAILADGGGTVNVTMV